LRNEADKLLESISGNKALCEAGVLEKMRSWPRKKIMGLLLGALITMTTAQGIAGPNADVISAAGDQVIEQISGGDGASDSEKDAVDKMLGKVADKYADKIENKVDAKGGTGAETEKEAAENGYTPTTNDDIRANLTLRLLLYQRHMTPDEIKRQIEIMDKSSDEGMQKAGKALLSALDKYEVEKNDRIAKANLDVHEKVPVNYTAQMAKSFVDRHLKNGKTETQIRNMVEKFTSDSDNEYDQKAGKALLRELEHRGK